MTAANGALPVAGTGRTLRTVGTLLRRRLGIALLAVVAMVIAAVAGIAVPAVVGAIVDTVVEGGAEDALVRYGLVLVGLAVGGAVATVVAELLVAWFGEPVVADLRERVLQRALQLESGRVEAAGAGDLLSRLAEDVRELSQLVRAVLVEFTGAALTVLLTLGGMALIDVRLGLAAACAVPVQVWATRRYVRVAPALYASMARARGAESHQLLDSIGGADTVRSLGLRGDHLGRIATRAQRLRTLHLRAVRVQTTFSQRLNLAELVGVVAILVAGYLLVERAEVTAGQATAAALMFLRLFGPINVVLGLVDDVLSAFAGLARLVGVLETPVPVPPPEGPAPRDGSLSIRGVSFAYRADRPVLHGVDLVLSPGEHLAIVGTSGAGKTTLGTVVAGLRPPSGGTVWLGGVPMPALSPRQRREAVVVLSQDVHVFRGTLRDDLGMARPEAGDGELREALARVGAVDWVLALPEGLDTRVGTGGHLLTAVQTQQLALARLALADPLVAVLDEATADADSDGARVLEDSAAAVLEGRTALVIAHRLSQAARCDRVAVLEAGRLIELGTHGELVAAGGAYAGLWEAWERR